MDINKVTLVGRLVRKPELRQLASGQTLASFSVATNYVWRDFKSKEKKDKTEFHRMVAWGKLADIAHTYLDKGSRVYVEGRISYRDWKDAKGQPRRSSDIIIDELIMLGHAGTGTKKSDEAFAKEEPSEKELVVEEV